MKLSRRSSLAVLAAAVAFAVTGAHAQGSTFPSKPVHIVVGYPAGSGNDLIARAVGQRLSEVWKQPVIVDNKAGASGVIGAESVARAAPDGYTLLLTGSSHLIQAAVARKGPYNPVDDFTPISVVGTGPLVLEVNEKVAAKTVPELIELAKSKPLTFGSAGTGTSPHIAGEMFAKSAGIKMMHVPYKGSAPAQTDLMGGRVNMVFQVIQVALPHIKAGKVRALAVTSKTRSPDLPDVPTMAEIGLPDAGLQNLVGPAGAGRHAGRPGALLEQGRARCRCEPRRAAAPQARRTETGELHVRGNAGSHAARVRHLRQHREDGGHQAN